MWLIVAGMTAVTYIPRLLPMVIYSGRTPRPWLRRVLRLVPYAAIGALILPDGLTSVDGELLPSLVGMVAAAATALVVRTPIVVVAAAVLAVIGVRFLLAGA